MELQIYLHLKCYGWQSRVDHLELGNGIPFASIFNIKDLLGKINLIAT